jgi:hypothetical protein
MVAKIIQYLYQSARSQIDYQITDSGSGPFISYWNTATLGQQPSQATLDATATSPAFLLWLSTHGGDAALTLRRQAKEALNQIRENEILIRAVAAVTADEINLIREWLTTFKAQTALATNLANFQSRVAGLGNMPERTLAQVRAAVLAKIDAGAVDT